MRGDVTAMIAVGLIWGVTNAVMRRGALVWDRRVKSDAVYASGRGRVVGAVRKWIDLVMTWQYSIPLLVNLSASAAFFRLLGDAPISLAVPVTNATTFAATAVAGNFLGEEVKPVAAIPGTALIVLGVWICIS